MRILVTGNMGYVGPGVIRHLAKLPGVEQLTGLDTGYFAHCLVGPVTLPECAVNTQVFKDVRTLTAEDVAGYDVVVYLAAISNDPMGKAFEDVTLDVNWRSAVRTAEMAKRAGATSFVFASSCSIDGSVESGVADESSPVNPLTAYARSKVNAETALKPLASGRFVVSCLRFATACGASERLRLDLVLNDFVAGAMASKSIAILSDGTPWRPLIHVEDMARSIAWAAVRPADRGGPYLVANVGTNTFNYQVKELADAALRAVRGATVTINTNALPDKRSYRVSFDRYAELAPDHVPRLTLDAGCRHPRSRDGSWARSIRGPRRPREVGGQEAATLKVREHIQTHQRGIPEVRVGELRAREARHEILHGRANAWALGEVDGVAGRRRHCAFFI